MFRRGLIALFVAGAAATPALAQQSVPVFGAGSPVASVKLKELGAGWLSVKVGGPSELQSGSAPSQLAGGIFGMMLGGGMGGGSTYSPPQYTRGATASLGSETFLIVYRAPSKSLDFGALMRMGQGGGELPLPDKLTPETTLSLVLVNVRSITSVAGIRPFNLQQELTESAKAVEEEAKLMKQLQQGPGGPPPGAGAEAAPDIFDSLDAPAPKKPTAPKRPAAPKKPAVKK
ncbi:MAG: hypothetical protein ACO1SX_12420 [Actinomycetota bacterium]